MNRLLALLLFALPLAAQTPTSTDAKVADLLNGGRALAERGSFEKAYQAFAEADALVEAAEGAVDEGLARLVDFAKADASWRSAVASSDPDSSRIDTAHAELEELLRPYDREAERDELWADVHESLGDLAWSRRGNADWGGAWSHYSSALDWWAGSRDVDRARARYLAIVKNALTPSWWGNNSWDWWGNRVDQRVLEQAASIAVEPDDRAWTQFFLGFSYYRWGSSYERQRLAPERFAQVLELGKSSEWFDDALFYSGLFQEERGTLRYNEGGGASWTPDYPAALVHYRRLVDEFSKGESRYYDRARDRIKDITRVEVAVGVDRFFVPGSIAQANLRWRNVDDVELLLFAVDLTRDVGPASEGRNTTDFVPRIDVSTKAPVQAWRFATDDDGKHVPGSERITVPENPARGAYLLVARAGGAESRELVLVSDAMMVTKAAGSGVLAWMTDLETGAPIAEANVTLTERYRVDSRWRVRTLSGVTGADGIAFFDGIRDANSQDFFVAGSIDGRQAFATGNSYRNYSSSETWRVYAHSDRPAYRPNDEVQWKIVARVDENDGYRTPVGSELTWKIVDPRGSVISEGESTLNDYGAAWGTVATTDEHPLGIYSIQLRHGGSHVSSSQLFRLEEYKLPEFEVAVSLPDDPDRPGMTKLFRLGDTVEAQIQADYYFGGAVGGAEVEVLVYQRPYYFSWPVRREYPWFYSDSTTYRGWWGGPGQLVKQETLHADENGRVIVPIDTQAGSSNDLEYTIEARVVDSSRRQVVATQTLRVTRQAYFVQVQPTHKLHEPGDRVELDFQARDANDNPVAARGEVVVTRDTWAEIWRTPTGAQVRGAALDALKRDHPVFPPPAQPGQPGWTLQYNGYEHEEVARTTVLIDDEGSARWSFTAPREGYYNVTWTSEDDRRQRITASASFWAADGNSKDLGYRPGGVDILVDREAFEVGQRAAVMLSAHTNDRYVLFTVEGEDLKHYEVVHLTGTVKLVTFDLTDAHVPNVWLGATMVSDRQTWWDQEEVVVPPTKSFLAVDVAFDRDAYEPGDDGKATVTVRDHEGNPVVGEVSLAIFDQALAYIQGDLAGDPRQFFYGERDPQYVQTASTLNHRSFQLLVENEDGQAVDERQAGSWSSDRDEGKRENLRALGYAGVMADTAMEMEEGAPRASFGLAAKSASRAGGGPSSPVSGGFDSLAPGGAPDLGEVQVRSDFRDTAVWAAAVVTDAEGRATVDVPFPDSTTRWHAVARAADTGARIGIGENDVRTRQPLIARLQAPRFFTVGDEVVISGNLNNQTEADLIVHALLEADGVHLLGRLEDGELTPAQAGPLTIPAGGQTRVDWRVRVEKAGDVVLTLKAASPEHADGMERKLVAHPHGVDVLVARSGRMSSSEMKLALDLPAARNAASLEVQLTPSLAVTMLDALPYLVDYPYGCTEQTLSRFVPTVVAARTLAELGLSREDALDKVYGGVEREHVGQTHRDVAGVAKLDDATEAGLKRLYDFQHSDGGWAWWKDGDSDHWMTAYVVWGLTLAQEAGAEVRGDVLDRGRRYLELEIVEAELQVDLQAWMLFALSRRLVHDESQSEHAERAFANLWEKRAALNAYTRALFALAAHDLGKSDEALILVENLANGVIRDDSPDTSVVMIGEQTGRDDALKTAHWGEDGVWHRWSDGGVEATAFALSAFLAIDPSNELVQPTLNWLLQNRRAGNWSNTRDTAICVLALAEYLKTSGELAGDVEYELFVNGESVAKRSIAKDALLAAPSRFDVPPELLRDGANEVRVVQAKGSPLYFAAHARFFSGEEPIPARGNQMFVRREYYRLKAVPTLLKGVLYEKEKLEDGAQVRSGDRIEVVLTAETKNHLEYLMFEDLKPAGFEAVQVRSGEWMIARELKRNEVDRRFVEGGSREETLVPGRDGRAYAWKTEDGYTGRTRNLYQELRDRRVALFADKLPQGVWEMRYELRAETPGSFHALPVLGEAMYVPEIRCNSNELRVGVTQKEARSE